MQGREIDRKSSLDCIYAHRFFMCVIAFVAYSYLFFGEENCRANTRSSECVTQICTYDTIKVAKKGSISPKDMGLTRAKNDVERYWVIYYTHAESVKKNIPIDYSGIDSLGIELPSDAKSIKVVGSIDFKGLKLHIKNDSKNMFLFMLNNKETNINIPQEIIDGDDFSSIPELRKGTHQLILSDDNKWVEYREGHDYGHIRKDIRLIVDGKARNRSVMPYGNKTNTKVITQYTNVDTTSTVLSNLTLIRSCDSKRNTYFIRATNVDNIEIRNMSFYTPETDERYGDHIVSINNCTNVVFRNVNIQGSYSQRRKYGYGIAMNNVWNVKCYNLKGDAKWGIWGNNNVNSTYLKGCNLNRYDIHCYGRDIIMEDCYFHDGNLQLASVYGDVIYRRCTLFHYQPVYIRADYNSYVPFDLKLLDCEWYPTEKQNAIAYMARLDNKKNKRCELEKKCWPNIYINNLKVYSGTMNKIYLYKVKGNVDYRNEIGYLSSIAINDINVNGSDLTMEICNELVKIKNIPRFAIENASIHVDTKSLKYRQTKEKD